MKRILVLWLIVCLLLPAAGSFAQPEDSTGLLRPDGPDLLSKLTSDVLALTDETSEQEFLIQFQTDESLFERALDKQLLDQGYDYQQAHRVSLVQALQAQAERTQQPFVRALQAAEIEYESFYIVNMMWLKTDLATIRSLAQSPQVQAVYLNKTIQLHLSQSDVSLDNVSQDIEWNIKQVGADQVWRRGIRGQGVTVGIIDSGGDWTHPALKAKWRAYNPDQPDQPLAEQVASSWFDAFAGKELPIDENNHATHCLGTILGQEPDGRNTVGVAPAAQWIAARAFGGDGSTSSKILLSAAQWMLAPGGDASLAPDVINNSWGGGDGIDDWFREVVRAWRAACIVPVFAAGNQTGFEPAPWPGSIEVPGNYPESLAVAATDQNNRRGSFSKLGPSPYDERLIKPEISAPGVAVRSSLPGGRYGAMDGTSMAAPHITGVVALMLSSNPGLAVEEIIDTLSQTANPLTDSAYPTSPNMGYGYGLVNALAAVDYVAEGLGEIRGSVLIEGRDEAQPSLIVYPGPDEAFMDHDFHVSAEAADDVSIVAAELVYRWEDETDFYVAPMSLQDGSVTEGRYLGYVPKTPFFGADIPAQQPLKEGRMSYFVRVRDFAGNTIESDTFSAQVKFGVTRDNWREDMQTPLEGWQITGDWIQGIPTAYGEPEPYLGQQLVGTNLGKPFYNEYTRSYLISPPIDLRDDTVAPATLKYRQWYEMALNSTIGRVLITDNNGYDWYELSEDFITGSSDGWSQNSVSLVDYVGSQDPVYIAFVMDSGGYTSGPGWYLNQVELEGHDVTPPAPPQRLQASKTVQGIQLRWQASEDGDVKYYQVFRRAEQETEFYQINPDEKKLEFMDAQIEPGVVYTYQVRAVDHVQNLGEFCPPVSLTGLAYETLYFNDFEDNDGQFTTETVAWDDPDVTPVNDWEWGEVAYGPEKAWSGAKLWATNLSGDYHDNHNARLISPPISLPDVEQPLVVSFRSWYDGEKYWSVNRLYDYGYLEISTDDGQTYTKIPNALWAGHLMRWENPTFDLSPYKGQTIRLAFRFISDAWSFGSETFMGWYVDDIGFYHVTDDDYELPPPQIISQLPELIESDQPARELTTVTSVSDLHTMTPGAAASAVRHIPVDEAYVMVEETGYQTAVNRADGTYMMKHPVEGGQELALRAGAYGYYPQTRPIVLDPAVAVEEHFVLTKIPRTEISGRLYDAITDQPVAGAAVRLVEDGRIQAAISDQNGHFRLPEIFAGDYTIHVYHPDYEIARVAHSALMDSTNPIDIGLQPFVPYANELAYDNNLADDAASLRGTGVGFSSVFAPEQFAHVKAVKAFFWGEDFPNPGGNEISLAVMKATKEGLPLDEVIGEAMPVTVKRGEWNSFDVSHLGIRQAEPFVVTFIQTKPGDSSPAMAIDPTALAGNKHCYIYAGQSFRPAKNEDITGSWMIRAVVDYSMGHPAIEQVSPAQQHGDIYYSRAERVDISGPIAGAAKVEIYRDGDWYDTVTSNTTTYQAKVRLNEGLNTLKVRAMVDEKRTDFSPEITVIRDRVAPEIHLSAPSETVSREKVVDLVGQVVDANLAQLVINDQVVACDEAGNFRHAMILRDGRNDILLTASDLAGNQTVQPLTLEYQTGANEATILSAWPQNDVTLYAGDTVQLEVTSDLSDGLAFYSLRLPQLSALTEPNMTEISPGVYQADWQVPAGSQVDGVQVEYHLIGSQASVTGLSDGRLTIRPGGIQRLAGANRYATAARIAGQQFASSDKAVLMSGQDFPDALAGGLYAASQNVPALLTPADHLAEETLAALDQLAVNEVEIIGGEKAISPAVAKQLEAHGFRVSRRAGADRYQTSIALAQAARSQTETVFLVSGQHFADGLSVSPLAYQMDGALLLSPADHLPDATLKAISDFGARQVVIVGGEKAISSAVADQLKQSGLAVERISGADRYQTNLKLYQTYLSDEPRGVFITSGETFADALCGGGLAARWNQPLMLAQPNQLPARTEAQLAAWPLREITVLGGNLAISPAVYQQLEAMLK